MVEIGRVYRASLCNYYCNCHDDHDGVVILVLGTEISRDLGVAADLIWAGGTESYEAPWLENFRFDHASVCIASPCSPIDSLGASMICSLATSATARPGSPGLIMVNLQLVYVLSRVVYVRYVSQLLVCTQSLPLLFLYRFAHLRRAQAEEAQRARRAALMAAEQGFEGEVYDTL